MEVTYSSSFESEDDEVGQDPQNSRISNGGVPVSNSNIIEQNVELDLLCKGVSDLPLATNDRQVRSKTSWVFDANVKTIEKASSPSDYENKTLKDPYGKTRNCLKPVFYLKRNISTFKGSASINRRKQLQQIEHDNLVSM